MLADSGPRMLLAVVWATLVTVIHSEHLHMSVIDTMKPHTIVGTLLAFLLVFRTSMSYSRYCEGRNHFEASTKHARDFMMLVRRRPPPLSRDSRETRRRLTGGRLAL